MSAQVQGSRGVLRIYHDSVACANNCVPEIKKLIKTKMRSVVLLLKDTV